MKSNYLRNYVSTLLSDRSAPLCLLVAEELGLDPADLAAAFAGDCLVQSGLPSPPRVSAVSRPQVPRLAPIQHDASGVQALSLPEIGFKATGREPRRILLSGEWIDVPRPKTAPISGWQFVSFSVAEQALKSGLQVPFMVGKRFILSTDTSQLGERAKPVQGGAHRTFLNTNLSAQDHVKVSAEMCRAVGIDPYAVKVVFE